MLVSFLKRPAPANPVAVARAKAIIWKCDTVTSAYLAFYRLYRYPSSADAIAHTNYTVEDKLPTPRFRDEEALSDDTQYWVRWAWIDIWENESARSSAVNETNRKIVAADLALGSVTDPIIDNTAPGTPTGLTLTQTAKTVDGGDGRIEVGINATWTAPIGGVTVRRYKVEISDGTLTWYDTTKQSSYKFFGVVGKTYTVKVTAESIKTEGSQTSGVSISPTAATAAPSAPTWVSGAGIRSTVRGVVLRIVKPSDKDFDEAVFFRNTTNDSSTAVEIGRSRTNRFRDEDDLATGATYFYWSKSSNRSGVLSSAFSTAQSVVFRGVKAADLDITDLNALAENTDLSLGPNIGWTYGGAPVIVDDGANNFRGNYVAKIAYTGTAVSLGFKNNARFPVRAGEQYYIGTMLKTDASYAAAALGARLSWRDKNGTEITASAPLSGPTPAPNIPWGEYGIKVTVPATSTIAYGVLELFSYNQTAGTVWFSHCYARSAVTEQMVDATAPGTPTGLTLAQVARNTDGGDGRVEVAIRATWTAPSSSVPVKRYVLEINDGTDTYYRYTKKSSEKFPAVVGKTYTVKVNAEAFGGAEGSQTSGVSLAPVAKTTAPGNVTSVSIEVRAGNNLITWVGPSDTDVLGYNVYFHTANVVGSATLIGSRVLTTLFVDGKSRSAGTSCYYWVAPVNRSGVEGTKVAASNNPQTSRIIQTADVAAQAITSTEVAPMAVVPSKLFPREFANLFSDPEMVEVGNFTIISGASSIVRVANDQTVGLGPGRFMMSATSTTVATDLIELAGPVDIPVEAGVTYRFSSYLSGAPDLVSGDPSGATFIGTIYADFYRVNSSGQPTTLISSAELVAVAPGSVGAYAVADFTAPANAQVARLRAVKQRIAGGTNFHTLYWGSPEVRRKVYSDEIYTDANFPWNIPRAIGGLTLSNNASDPTNDIDVASGICADIGTFPPYMLNLNSSKTKRLDALFVVGSNQGGRDTGSIADGTWHVFLIKADPSSGSQPDILFSQSPTLPTMPSGFTRKRRIGSFIRSGGAILAFKQLGDEFLLDEAVLDVDVSNQGTSFVTRTLTVPTGVQVDALIRVLSSNALAHNLLLSSFDVSDQAPAGNASPLATTGATAGVSARTDTRVRTNTSGQIRSRSDATSTTLRIATYGWVDHRLT